MNPSELNILTSQGHLLSTQLSHLEKGGSAFVRPFAHGIPSFFPGCKATYQSICLLRIAPVLDNMECHPGTRLLPGSSSIEYQCLVIRERGNESLLPSLGERYGAGCVFLPIRLERPCVVQLGLTSI